MPWTNESCVMLHPDHLIRGQCGCDSSPKHFILKNKNTSISGISGLTLSVFLLSHSCYNFWALPLEISEANSSEDKLEVFRNLILEPDTSLIYY